MMSSNARSFAVFLFLVAISLCFSPLVPAIVGQSSSNWVKLVSVYDETTGQRVSNASQLLAGDTYNVTFDVNVPFSDPSAFYVVSIDPSMELYGSQFWYVLSPSYPGFNVSTFDPTHTAIRFSQVQGTLELAAVFTVPNNITYVGNEQGVVIQRPLYGVDVISVLAGTSIVGYYSPVLVSSQILQYQQLYTQDSLLLSSHKVNSLYTPAYQAVMAQAQSLYGQGLVSQAISTLELLNSSNFPPPPSPPSDALLFAGFGAAGALAVVAVVALVLFSRTRSRVSAMESAITSAANQLSSLKATLSSYDQRLAEEVDRLTKKLREAKE
ncbi:hypothetical protein GCM10007116_17280 [Sulfodiicoccus acidiphilus]|nr:hypothetical protein [Sulfodiicoccus acidiphilus]GGU00589.1 hypothetical protein GCM10007116_17280 [Sulfodiicoccus acidiphilus]